MTSWKWWWWTARGSTSASFAQGWPTTRPTWNDMSNWPTPRPPMRCVPAVVGSTKMGFTSNVIFVVVNFYLINRSLNKSSVTGGGCYYNSEDNDVMNYLSTVIVDGQNQFHCDICRKMTPHHRNMKRHMILKHAKPTNVTCEFCSRVFRQHYHLQKHLRLKQCCSSPQ